jgi:hypothetical protein
MTDKQPEALRLAEMLEYNAASGTISNRDEETDSAAELRRLHALSHEMGEALNALLFLINRDAPQLSGKTMGYAQTVLAKWKESK